MAALLAVPLLVDAVEVEAIGESPLEDDVVATSSAGEGTDMNTLFV